MIQNRSARFWILGSVMFLGTGLYIGYIMVGLKRGLTIPEIAFSVGIFFAGLTTVDTEIAKVWSGRILGALKFWQRNGTPPTP